MTNLTEYLQNYPDDTGAGDLRHLFQTTSFLNVSINGISSVFYMDKYNDLIYNGTFKDMNTITIIPTTKNSIFRKSVSWTFRLWSDLWWKEYGSSFQIAAIRWGTSLNPTDASCKALTLNQQTFVAYYANDQTSLSLGNFVTTLYDAERYQDYVVMSAMVSYKDAKGNFIIGKYKTYG